jgi:hypothetical protein
MFMNSVRHICTALILITSLVDETYINERNIFYKIPALAIERYIIISCHTRFVYFTTLVPLICSEISHVLLIVYF